MHSERNIFCSENGYEEMASIEKAENMKLFEQTNNDIVGFLHNVPAYFNPSSVKESKEQIRVFGQLDDFLKSEEQSFCTRDTVLQLTNEYGMAAEENGFRKGFETAMRICMQGMAGGI